MEYIRPIPAAICILCSLALCALMAGCATTAPTRLDLGSVLDNPMAHKNKRVELTGNVLDYEPARGDTYRTLFFALGFGPDEKIPVSVAGYNAEAIAKASALVKEAFDSREQLTAVGKLKVEADEGAGSPELKLDAVEYRGRKIDVTRGRKTQPGFEVGGFVFSPSIAVGATITP